MLVTKKRYNDYSMTRDGVETDDGYGKTQNIDSVTIKVSDIWPCSATSSGFEINSFSTREDDAR